MSKRDKSKNSRKIKEEEAPTGKSKRQDKDKKKKKKTKIVSTDPNGSSLQTGSLKSEKSSADVTAKEKSTTSKEPLKPDVWSPEAKKVAKQFVKYYSKLGLHALRLQYNEMKSVPPPFPEKKAFDENHKKARYKDIPCWDKTRVELTWPKDEHNNFIHANVVKNELLDTDLICTQGPTDNTVGDFWRLVWQEKVNQIIMLCQCVELNKPKCSQYWPNKVGDSIEHYGLTITCEKVETPDKSFIYTKLSIQHKERKVHVDHRQWITWPDKSVPKTPLAPFRLLQFTRKRKNASIIHCSAGVGRTGTLVALELMYRTLYAARSIDLKQLLLDLRGQRSHAVQTEDQYLYLLYAMFQFCHLKQMANPYHVKKFYNQYVIYLKMLNAHGGKNLPMEVTEGDAWDKESKVDQPEEEKGDKTDLMKPEGKAESLGQSKLEMASDIPLADAGSRLEGPKNTKMETMKLTLNDAPPSIKAEAVKVDLKFDPCPLTPDQQAHPEAQAHSVLTQPVQSQQGNLPPTAPEQPHSPTKDLATPPDHAHSPGPEGKQIYKKSQMYVKVMAGPGQVPRFIPHKK